jgi:hypothetical protein
MEVSDVKRRVAETIERARRAAAARRTRADEAAHEYAVFLDTVAVPLVRQIAGVLKAQGFPFGVFTPAGSVRLASEKSADDYIELSLDSSGDEPAVVGHTRRTRGRRVIERERPIAGVRIREITDDQLLTFLLEELEGLVER